MAKILAWFWCRRFALVFSVVFSVLAVLDIIRRGITTDGLASAMGWGAAAGFIAATVATYWAYRIQCKVVLGASKQSWASRAKHDD
jgi:hypothetical protein